MGTGYTRNDTANNIADGNIIIMDYINTNRTEANGASTFTLNGSIGGFSTATVTTISLSLIHI